MQQNKKYYYDLGYSTGNAGQGLDFTYGSLPDGLGNEYQTGWVAGITDRMYQFKNMIKKSGENS